MAINEAVLAKKIDDDSIEFIYPKTSSNLVEHTEDETVKDKLDELDIKVADLENGSNIPTIITSLAGCNGFYMEGDLGTVTADTVDDFCDSYGLGSDIRKDVYVGCHFTANINGIDQTLRIAGFDTSYTGYSYYGSLGKRHATIVPDNYLMSDVYMNSSGTTDGAYYNSYMNQTIIPEIDSQLQNVFGDHLIQFHEYLTSSVSSTMTNYNDPSLSGVPNGSTVCYFYSILMSEMEVWGKRIYSCEHGNVNTFSYVIEKQLPLFWHSPKYIVCNNGADGSIGNYYWLRDIASSSYFCLISNGGSCGYRAASTTETVRPRFAIG